MIRFILPAILQAVVMVGLVRYLRLRNANLNSDAPQAQVETPTLGALLARWYVNSRNASLPQNTALARLERPIILILFLCIIFFAAEPEVPLSVCALAAVIELAILVAMQRHLLASPNATAPDLPPKPNK